MNIVLGANGHVGSAVAMHLLEKGQPVKVVLRTDKNQSYWEKHGAKVSIADVFDTDMLTGILKNGQRLFLLNPPASPDTDTAQVEKQSVSSILKAVQASHFETIVAESTYGAQPGDRIGDLGVLYDMEQELVKIPASIKIIRAAYYMSNWEQAVHGAVKKGVIETLYPATFKLPMVSPADIGKFAAELLKHGNDRRKIIYFEGPERYSALDVARAFSLALDRQIEVKSHKRDNWCAYLEKSGFSPAAAGSMVRMSEITLEEKYEIPLEPEKGQTTLESYILDMVALAKKGANFQHNLRT
ncbi:NAD(P)H-binding protein [Pedobacter ginsengiterrae]|uniref:NAD(P)H-binding protein n=1 Tax=Pedobacter ginsengiterrae TaxID=871696 RepID=A0ABP7PG37_9SPHI